MILKLIVLIVQYVLMKKELPPLAICILMDIVGYASYAIPVFGEFSDLIWAPLSGFIFFKMFGGKKGIYGALFSFAEEILPFSDFIPTFSIMWVWEYLQNRKYNVQVRNKN